MHKSLTVLSCSRSRTQHTRLFRFGQQHDAGARQDDIAFWHMLNRSLFGSGSTTTCMRFIAAGALFQRPPLISAVKRQLRIRTIYESKLYQ